MNILFAMDRKVDRGSIQAVGSYVRAGAELGHTIAVYGREDPRFPVIQFSTETRGFDHVVFVIESWRGWMSGLRMPRLLYAFPRERRAILDADGMYNPRIAVDGYDRNYPNEEFRSEWIAHYDLLTDRVMQPTREPLQPGVRALPFYGYEPAYRIGPDASPPKRFDILHVGHNWWRWRDVSGSLLPAIEAIRPHLDGVCFVGSWWEAPPAGAAELGVEDAFGDDAEWFRRLGIQVWPAVRYTEVIPVMSAGRVNIMTQRPLFRRLRLFTSKFFEIFCADTVPLVMIDPDHAEAVYGPAGRELTLHEGIAEKLLDALEHPRKYRQLADEVRGHLITHHSYRKRVQELVAALEG
jgi:hypothetical protein